jgi:hypothetical protein
MDMREQSVMARRILRVAAAVLVDGWCSAAVIGLVSWTVPDRVAGFPVAYITLPLAAVFLVTYALGDRGQRRLDGLPARLAARARRAAGHPFGMAVVAARPVARRDPDGELVATALSMRGNPRHRMAAPAPRPS